MVAGASERRLPRRISEMLRQPGSYRHLDDPPGELAQRAGRPVTLLRPEPIQRIVELVRRQPSGQRVNCAPPHGSCRTVARIRQYASL
jgi:hypothetical protein